MPSNDHTVLFCRARRNITVLNDPNIGRSQVNYSRLFTIVVLPTCFLHGRSAPVHRLFLLFSASLLASFALVARSASVRRLFLLF